MEYRGEKDEGNFRDDRSDFDNAMDEHAPAIRGSLQNTDALVRGIVTTMIPPQRKSKSKSSRRASASITSPGTVKQRDHPHRAASLSYTNGSSSLATPPSGLPSVDDISLLINRLASERQKTSNLQGSLTQAHADLAFQTKRFEEADGKLKDLRKKEEEANAKRKELEIEVSKIREQLRFIKSQYDGAIDEIKRAQKDIDTLDDERQRAVDEVRREREKVRKLVEEKKLREAREAGYQEGKKLGVEEGVKMGRQEGHRYGIKDGREAEKERQKRAMLDLVQRDDLYDMDTNPTRIREEPAIVETYNVVGDETPAIDQRRAELHRQHSASAVPARSKSLNVHSMESPTPVIAVDPRHQTANVQNIPLVNTIPNAAPGASATFAPTSSSYGGSNPSTNTYSGAVPNNIPPNPPSMSTRGSNRISAPPRINSVGPEVGYGRAAHSNFNIPGERSFGDKNAGLVGNGPVNRPPVKFSNKSSGKSGRASVTPPSTSTQGGRSTPMEQYELLNGDRGHGGRRGSEGLGGLMDPVVEMTPIMEGMSEPSPSPVKAYFGDAAMGVRLQQPVQNSKHGRKGHSYDGHSTPQQTPYNNVSFESPQSSYVPPHRRAPQPSPTATNPSSDSQWPRRSPAPPAASSASNTQNRQQRKPVPNFNGVGPKHTKAHARAASESVVMPPIDIDPGTPPEARNQRNSKMHQAGGSLLGSPSFAPQRMREPSPLSHTFTPDAHGRSNGNIGGFGPNGTPSMPPQPMRSPGTQQRLLAKDTEYRPSDPSGGTYHPSSQGGSGHLRSMSLQEHAPSRSPARSPILSPVQLGQPVEASSPARYSNPNLAQPTPRHYSRSLDQSPEEIQIRSPNYNTPTPIGIMPPSTVMSPFGVPKKPSTAEDKKRRREGFVDYDDNVPEITSIGYGVQDTEPPNTTRSRVQSMYGIPGETRQSGRTPKYESAPLPINGRTPMYESAPLPPPKSARMLKTNLPQQQFAGAGNPYSKGFGANGAPAPSPQRSQSSSQYRREMENDLDTPIDPYGHAREEESQESHFADIDKLEEVAERYDTRSGRFLPQSLPTVLEGNVEVVPPPNDSPTGRPVHQNTSFLGTGVQPMAPPSPNTATRGRLSDYVGTSHVDETGFRLPPNPAGQYGNPSPSPSPIRQSLPITASARSSSGVLPPIQPSDLPWATGRTANSQLPRVSTYETAPPSAIPPTTATTWGGFRDSSQTLEPVGPIGGNGLGFTWTNSQQYELANRSQNGTDRLMTQNLPPLGSARATPSGLLGSARSGVVPIPGAGGSVSLHPAMTPSQVMLADMLTDPQVVNLDEEPIVPSMPSGNTAKKGKKKGKKK